MSEETARRALVDMGMNSSSAHIYLYNFVAMMNGKVFKRSMKIADIRSYLMYIEKKYGKRICGSALDSLEKHIQYAEDQGFPTKSKKDLLLEIKERLL